MTEADLIHTDVKGDLYMRNKGNSIEFTLINEMEDGSRVDTVEVPSHVLLKILAGAIDSEILMRTTSR